MSTDDNKISELYQQGNNQEPPEHLDICIMNAAHEAVAPVADKSVSDRPVVKSKSPFSGGWPAITSVAALLLITVILVPLVEQEPVKTPISMSPVPMTSEVMSPTLMSSETILADEELEMEDVETMSQKNILERRMLLDKQAQQSRQRSVQSDTQSKKTLLPEVARGKQEKSESSVFIDSLEDAANFDATANKRESEQSIVPERLKIKSSVAGKTKPLESDALQQFVSMMQNAPVSALSINENVEENIPTPKKWLEDIRQLISNDELDVARDELDKFKLNYPDEKIDPSILVKLKR